MTSKKGWLVWERKIHVTVMQITDKMGQGIPFEKAVEWTYEDYLTLEVRDGVSLVKQAAQWLILDSIA
jgi:hypothetical protein